MQLQRDFEFNQNAIKYFDKQFNVGMFHTKLRGGKAFAAEQKIREFNKILLKSKRFEKNDGRRLKPNELIRKAAEHMKQNNIDKVWRCARKNRGKKS